MSELTMTQDATRDAGLGGKYLTFRLAGEEYGVEILKVREIIGLLPITAVPRTPDYVKGVINLRGKVIPVVSLRTKFGMPHAEGTERTCILVVDVALTDGGLQMGLVVDEVSEVRDITADQIAPPPTFGAQVDTRFILGIGKLEDSVVLLLDIDTVLSEDELAVLDQATA